MAALPTTPKPAGIEVRSHQPTRVSIAHSLKRQVRTGGAQRWSIKVSYPSMPRASFMPLWGFLLGQDGQYGTFTMTAAGLLVPLGSWGGVPTVNGALAVGAVTGALDGLTNNITGVGKAGDFFKFSGHTKVYQLTAAFDSNGSGQAAAVLFRPALVAAVADNETITSASVPFTGALTSDTNSFPAAPGAIVPSFELDFIEVY